MIVASTLGVPGLGGGETFLRGLVNGLAENDNWTIAVVVPHRLSHWSEVDLNVERLPVRTFTGGRRFVHDLATTAALASRWGASVVHYPHEWAPVGVARPTVLTVQNLAWLHSHSMAEAGLKGAALRAYARYSSRAATAVGAVSEVARDIWLRHTRFDGPITVIREGFTDPGPPSAPTCTPRGGYVLCLSSRFRYKRSTLAIAAYQQSSARRRGVPLLVLGEDAAGPSGDDQVHYLGWRDHQTAYDLMKRARAVVMPSAVESFGLGALEALCAGTPTIVARHTAMEEWLRPMVAAVDPTPSAFAGAIDTALETPGRVRPDAMRAGFRWKDIAAEWENLYEVALSRFK